jgi:hypothetical protein
MTPFTEAIRHDLDVLYKKLNDEKLTRWQLARASNMAINITDCRGKTYTVGLGCEFEEVYGKHFGDLLLLTSKILYTTFADGLMKRFLPTR